MIYLGDFIIHCIDSQDFLPICVIRIIICQYLFKLFDIPSGEKLARIDRLWERIWRPPRAELLPARIHQRGNIQSPQHEVLSALLQFLHPMPVRTIARQIPPQREHKALPSNATGKHNVAVSAVVHQLSLHYVARREEAPARADGRLRKIGRGDRHARVEGVAQRRRHGIVPLLIAIHDFGVSLPHEIPILQAGQRFVIVPRTISAIEVVSDVEVRIFFPAVGKFVEGFNLLLLMYAVVLFNVLHLYKFDFSLC
mmetsp:Transcript_21580/g.38645  ORF Transcript_21580/g.38645 Transcript_21580/m.38645 type:complete len:254 (+) Transcript_21580:494-1255(+)